MTIIIGTLLLPQLAVLDSTSPPSPTTYLAWPALPTVPVLIQLQPSAAVTLLSSDLPMNLMSLARVSSYTIMTADRKYQLVIHFDEVHVHNEYKLTRELIRVCTSTCAGPPSSPRLAINSPPIINGADITVCWLPSNDRGGRDDFHYNIYRLAAESGQFLIINTEDILPNDENQVIENQNEPVCYTLTGLEEQSSFTIVVVASNGAANDADSFTDVSEVENRFIAFYVATGSSTVCPGVVNERCDVNNGACEQTCTDTATSVQCSCNTGYELDSDGRSCNG